MKGIKQRLKRPAVNNPQPKDAAWSRHDQRVWQAVASNQPTKVAAKLSKHPDVDVNRICPNVGYSVVHYAAAKGLDDCLNILLAHGADASSCDVTGATPLHAAARYGHKGTMSKLLASRSIKINLADKNSCTALHFAAFEGQSECVKLIAESLDVDLNCADKDGRSPLMVAAAMGRTQVCKELIESGCDLHHHDIALGHTALTLAADSGHAEVVRLLYDNGANHLDALKDGRTALQLAKQKERRSVIDALHVVQLTEAANKASNGPRLSTSSSKFKSDDTVKKRHSVDCILDSQTFIDDLVVGTPVSSGSRTPKPSRRNKEEKKAAKSNISRVKAAVGAKMKGHSRRGSDASGLSSTSTPRSKKKKDAENGVSPESNTLALYTDGSATFYEREVRFYDSNSSLDVSSTCSAMNNMSKSMDSLRKTPDEFDGASHTMSGPSHKVVGTDFSKRHTDAEISRLQKLNGEYEEKIKDLENNLTHATEVAVATERLQKNAEEVRNAQMTAATEDYKRKAAKIEKELDELKQANVKFERQNRELLKRVNTAQQNAMSVDNFKEQLKKNEEDTKTLRDENVLLSEKVEKLEAENKKLVKAVEKEKENESAIITQAKQKIIEAEQRCNQVERHAAEVEEERDAAVVRVSLAETQCYNLENKLSGVEQEIADVERKKRELEDRIGEEEQKLKEVEQQREETELKLGEVTKDKRKVERELKKVKEFSGRESVELAKYKAELEEIASIVIQCGIIAQEQGNNESAGFSKAREDVQKLIDVLKAEEGQLNHTQTEKKDLEDKFNTSLDEKNKKIEDLEKRINDTQNALSKKAAECSKLDSELKHTKTRLTKLDAEKKKLEEEYDSELTKARAELMSFQAAKLANADEFTRSKDEVMDLRQQLDEALNALEKQREESVPRDAYEADCAKIKQDADQLKKEVAKTLEKFAMVQLELANREQEISDLRVERNQSEARSLKYENEVAQLKSKCHESDVQVNILRQQLTDSKHKLEKAFEEVNTLRKSKRDMSIRLSAKNEEIIDSEKKRMENLKKQVDNLSLHIQESEKRYRDTVSIYRGHLLASVTGQLDTDVQQALQEIIKLRGKD